MTDVIDFEIAKLLRPSRSAGVEPASSGRDPSASADNRFDAVAELAGLEAAFARFQDPEGALAAGERRALLLLSKSAEQLEDQPIDALEVVALAHDLRQTYENLRFRADLVENAILRYQYWLKVGKVATE